MLVTDRQAVLDIYAEARERGRVLPCFCTENLTTTEAVLAAVAEHGRRIGEDNLPITLAVTNCYPPRPQTVFYTHTRSWNVGLRLFLADLRVLTEPPSPFSNLRVLVHLDHVQPGTDDDLLAQDLAPFSSIMYDASGFPLDENIRCTAEFVEQNSRHIVVEGACDQIVDAEGSRHCELTSPEVAEQYLDATGVDFVVANLGTEHRASVAKLRYHGNVAREIARRIGPKIVLHGCSSVPAGEVAGLFRDGVCKVNLWTALERDASPVLLERMVRDAAKVAGNVKATELHRADLLGKRCDLDSRADLARCTTAARQQIVYESMKETVSEYLSLWVQPVEDNP